MHYQVRHIEADLWDFGTVVDVSGRDRLCLRYVEERGFEFHELVWEREADGTWSRHKTISQGLFDQTGQHWIAELHSFDANAGQAIIRVGFSRNPPRDPGSFCKYSWRRINLVNSEPMVLLQECNDPFEPYAG